MQTENNLSNLFIDTELVKCNIYDTNEEVDLCRVYDPNNQEKLNVFESHFGHGKFVGWQNPETGIIYTFKEAGPVPQSPYDLFGIECSDGWLEIVKPLISYVENYNLEHPNDKIIIDQIKEKFGELRFYVTNPTEELNKMIEEAEERAHSTCEICGSSKDIGMTTTGWFTTCCRSCAKNIANNRKRPTNWRSHNDNKVYTFLPEKYDE